jgi:hypothetical protein
MNWHGQKIVDQGFGGGGRANPAEDEHCRDQFYQRFHKVFCRSKTSRSETAIRVGVGNRDGTHPITLPGYAQARLIHATSSIASPPIEMFTGRNDKDESGQNRSRT